MADAPRFGHGPGPRPQPDDDPDLRALFGEGESRSDPTLLAAARRIRSLAASHPAADPDPAYRAHLRASLMEEARFRQRSRPRHRRRFGLVFGAGLGIAGLAMVAVVLFSVVAVPGGAASVTVRASVQGNPRVPVTEAIQLSFNQPMVESSVVNGLTITPAVSYHAKWPDATTLVIAPQHDLVPNVSYVVSIARHAARAKNGAVPLSKVVIPFGTEPVAATAQGYPPSLVAINQMALADGATGLAYTPSGELLLTASGSVIAYGSTAPVPPPASPSTPSTAGVGSVYSLADLLAPLATSAYGAVASPDSQQLAYWTLPPGGAATLHVTPLGGQGPGLSLASTSSTTPEVAWLNDSSLLYSSSGQLLQVNLDGQTTAVYPFVKLGQSGQFTVASQAQALFGSPDGVPTIYDLSTGSSTTVPGLQGVPVWNAAGGQLAYIAMDGGNQALFIAGPYGGQPRELLVAPQGVTLGDLVYSAGSDYLAYTADTPGVGSQIGAVDIATGSSALISTRVGMSHLAWSPFGSELAALQALPGGASEVVSLQLSNPAPTAANGTAETSALDVASSLAQLQITDSSTALTQIQSLLAPGAAIPSADLLPGNFDRFYAVSSTPVEPSSASYQVAIELVRDANTVLPAASLQELVMVNAGGPSPLITAISQGSLTTLPTGPLVVSASANAAPGGGASFTIQFNSDLNAVTVGPQSISVVDSGQSVPNLQIAYQAATREVTVITGPLPPGPLVLTVAAPLSDVNHVQITVPYQLSLPSAPPATAGS